jgi:hypothetical protein
VLTDRRQPETKEIAAMTTIDDAAIQDHDVPLVPRPLSDDYDQDFWRRTPTHSGRPDPTDPTDLVQLWGHCAHFCDVTDDVRTDGLTVTEHGPWCRTNVPVFIDAYDAGTGQRLHLDTAVVAPYLHGTYHRTAIWRRPRREQQVQLTLIDGDGVEQVVNVSVGDALRLAAGLTRACAVADRLDQDLNGAKSRRAGGR